MAGTTTTGGAPSFKRTLGRRTIETAGLFTISEIIQGLEKIPPAPQFLKNILFPAIETVWGEQIAVEFQRGSTRAAVFCTPYKRAIAQPRERFRTSWVTPPDIKLSRDIRALDARFRVLGESPFSGTPRSVAGRRSCEAGISAPSRASESACSGRRANPQLHG
jgi:hypothetical protein